MPTSGTGDPRYTAYASAQAYYTAYPDAAMPLNTNARNVLRSFTYAGRWGPPFQGTSAMTSSSSANAGRTSMGSAATCASTLSSGTMLYT
ncbi:hypothetical protein [Amycolatopsis sp. H20-H5]|uniref:hypothetical protein n=1 Tax=Amycolatopsis sp. H20-H5 TaxID=3046309 RepID=UPI002DBCB1E3|nr:hypothetical protein [Amycolatopsis sp. H20-H5]MEC3977722.1 hypothetical protein [Amycolatopsis sp. H20-H5]